MSRGWEIAANAANALSILFAALNSVHTWWMGIVVVPSTTVISTPTLLTVARGASRCYVQNRDAHVTMLWLVNG